MRLARKNAVITGAGRASALLCAQEGAALACVAITPRKVDSAAPGQLIEATKDPQVRSRLQRLLDDAERMIRR